MNPTISIIIPVYNVEKYLRECLDSVLCQTFDAIEIICVDDGSTDSSPTILNEYAQKDSRIRVISQKNRGPGAARNIGLNIARGKYIYFMDSDDTIDPDLCRMTFIAAEYAQSDVLYFDAVVYDERCSIAAAAMLSKPRFSQVNHFYGIHQKPDINLFASSAWTPLKLFLYQFLQKHQITFSETLFRHEDLLFDWQCFLSNPRIGILPAKLYFYRNRQNSLMQTAASRQFDTINAYSEIKKLLDQTGRWEEFKNPFIAHKLYDFYKHCYSLAHPSIRREVRQGITDSLTADDWAYVPNLSGQGRHFYESLRGGKGRGASILFWFDWNVRRHFRKFLSWLGVGVWSARIRAAIAKRFVEKTLRHNRELCESIVNLQEEILSTKQ